MSDTLEDVIQSSIDEAQVDSEPAEEQSTSEATVEASNEATIEPTTTDEPAAEPSAEVTSPAAQVDAKPATQDEFEKKYGLQAQAPSGRENRIPYSRVKKITEKAVKDATGDLEKGWTTKETEFTAKIQDYEGRLGKVAQFEQIMANEPQRFLEMLGKIPAYGQIFQQWAAAINGHQQAQPEAQAQPIDANAEMPQPDQKLNDGTMVYSMEGLKKLLEWQANQAEARAVAKVAERYAPIEAEWQQNRQLQQIIPQVQAQIEAARKWPQFNENEDDITKALQGNPRLTLEGAYLQVVQPKIMAQATITKERETQIANEARQKVMAELKAKPTSTSVQGTASRPGPQAASKEPRDLMDVIAEQVKLLK